MAQRPAAERVMIGVEGPDAATFLQGLVTNDVRHAERDGIAWAALLTPQGKYLADFFIVARPGGGFWLDADAAQAPGLVQRLGLFQLDNPEVAVRLDSSERVVDFAREDFDVAIRYGDGNWPGTDAHHLFDITLTPMLSPSLLGKWGPLRSPADVVPLPWLDPMDPCWAEWLAAAGIETVAGGQPFRGSEDFGRFGAAGAKAAMAFVGSGAGPALHSEGYDFNDSLIAPVVRGFDAVRRGLVGP